jgi:two-component system chemotaxis sensor kinase CheA
MKLDFALFDSLLEPCVILNRDRRVVYCNETAGTLFGVSVRKIIRTKMTIENLLEFERTLDGIARIEKIEGPTPVQEVSVKSFAPGIVAKLQITIQPVTLVPSESDTDEKLWILFIRDVTLEERLQDKYKGELEQKEVIISYLKESKKIIEDYSLNLEVKVKERTQEMRELNQTMSALLDSLNQGFFLFDRQGICLSVYSKACEEILETKPVDKHFADVLNLIGEEKNKVQEWVEFLFEGALPFEESILFGPSLRIHSLGRHIELEYYPIYNPERKLVSVVVVASDTTSLLDARKEVEYEKNQAKLVLNILKNKKQINNFIDACKKIIGNLNIEMSKASAFRNQAEVFRGLHTLKGGASSLGIIELSDQCHKAENILAEIKLHEANSLEISEKWEKLGLCIKNIEVVFYRFLEDSAHLIGKSLTSEEVIEIPCSKFIKVIQGGPLIAINSDVQNFLIQEFMMEPVEDYIKVYQENIQNLALELGKKILPLEIINGHIKIFSEHYKNLFNSFVHIFRNAIDHGIETPEKRVELGKTDSGKIRVEFQQINEKLKIIIRDDGGGINPHSIRAKLLKKGREVTHESDEQILQHIFDAGFSTKQVVSNISGRGVGMDAVMQAAKEMGGCAQVYSHINEGTVFIIEVPFIRTIINKVA